MRLKRSRGDWSNSGPRSGIPKVDRPGPRPGGRRPRPTRPATPPVPPRGAGLGRRDRGQQRGARRWRSRWTGRKLARDSAASRPPAPPAVSSVSTAPIAARRGGRSRPLTEGFVRCPTKPTSKGHTADKFSGRVRLQSIRSGWSGISLSRTCEGGDAKGRGEGGGEALACPREKFVSGGIGSPASWHY